MRTIERFRTIGPTLAVSLLAMLALAGCKTVGQGPAKDSDQADNKSGDRPPANQAVERGDTVWVEYTLRLQDGTQIESSKGGQPYSFTVAAGNRRPTVIVGFNDGVLGMAVGESKTLTIPPERGYGPYRPELVKTVKRGPADRNANVGDTIPVDTNEGPKSAKVVKADKDTVTLDLNHELAGKTLVFDITLVELKKGE